jgi:2-iminoacetate synthase
MSDVATWVKNVIKQEEIDKYLIDGEDFINEDLINRQLEENKNPDRKQIEEIIEKACNLQRLEPEETAALLHVQDDDLWEEIFSAGLEIKRKVYDNRVVFFAPMYLSNLCVNNCAYCGFRAENSKEKRHVLSPDEIRKETAAIVSEGHKRVIAVYGEHPKSDADYIAKSIEEIYKVQEPSPNGKGTGNIRRVNVNAAPMSIDDLKKLWEVGIGTYQVFQETYHKETYRKMHPAKTVKGNYRWRLYALHRAMDAGIDDVAIGALFGLYDWRFEVMGLLYHTIDLEKRFGIGPHTISFPRMMHASNSAISDTSQYRVSDEDFKKLVAVLRLSVPYTGMIVTAREKAELRKEVIKVGCTQTDASTRIGVGGYTNKTADQVDDEQQFMLGDTRSCDEVIRELAEMGMITSFCTAGYRCGRTGDKIMGLLQECVEGKFCKLNAVLTYREYLDDYASEETKKIGEKVLEKELEQISQMDFYKKGKLYDTFLNYYEQVKNGKRDIFI